MLFFLLFKNLFVSSVVQIMLLLCDNGKTYDSFVGQSQNHGQRDRDGEIVDSPTGVGPDDRMA